MRQDEDEDGEARFGMLETIREYRAGAAGGQRRAERRAQEPMPPTTPNWPKRPTRALTGADQRAWLERLEREHDNMRAALGWARDSQNRAAGARLAAALWRFWYVHGYLSEGRSWLASLLEQSAKAKGARGDGALLAVRARALAGAATLASTQGDTRQTAILGEECLALCRRTGDREGLAIALTILGYLAVQQARLDEAASFAAEALSISRALGDPWILGRALSCLGQTAYFQMDYDRAVVFFEECLLLNQRSGSLSHSAITMLYLGHVMREQGDLDGALSRYRESLRLSRELGDKLRIERELVAIASISAARGQMTRAARQLGAAAALRQTIGSDQHPLDRDATAAAEQAARDALGDDFARITALGRAMPLEQALADALDESD